MMNVVIRNSMATVQFNITFTHDGTMHYSTVLAQCLCIMAKQYSIDRENLLSSFRITLRIKVDSTRTRTF